jgi:2'-5' RNA ligase
MRCFVAVDLPEEIKEKIQETQRQFSNFDAKLVEKQNLHFTLKFLGEIDDEQIKKIEQILAELANKTPSFTVLINGMGAFPNLSYIRVVWIGAVSDEFINLHKAVSAALGSIGKNEAKPHLTIARIRSPRNKETIARIIKRYEKESFGSMLVDRIILKKSTLTPRGPIYENLKILELSK